MGYRQTIKNGISEIFSFTYPKKVLSYLGNFGGGQEEPPEPEKSPVKFELEEITQPENEEKEKIIQAKFEVLKKVFGQDGSSPELLKFCEENYDHDQDLFIGKFVKENKGKIAEEFIASTPAITRRKKLLSEIFGASVDSDKILEFCKANYALEEDLLIGHFVKEFQQQIDEEF